MGEFIDRLSVRQGEKPPPELLPDPTGFGRFPAIWDFMTCQARADGKKRRLATLTFFFDGDFLRVVMNDRDGQRAAWACGVTLDGVLDALDRDLQSGDVEWRRRGV